MELLSISFRFENCFVFLLQIIISGVLGIAGGLTGKFTVVSFTYDSRPEGW